MFDDFNYVVYQNLNGTRYWECSFSTEEAAEVYMQQLQDLYPMRSFELVKE